MSLRLRIVLAITLLLLTGSVVGVAAAGWQANRVLREELATALAGGRLTILGASDLLARSDQPDRDLARLTRSFDGARHLKVSLETSTGAVIAASHPLPVRPAPAWFAALFRPGVPPLRLAAAGGDERVLVLEPVAANDVAALWSEFLDLTGVLAVSLGVGSLVIWLTVGRALLPLSEFSAAFVRIGEGDYAARVRAAGPLELARLGHAVNDMVAALAAMRERNRRLEDQITTLQEEERADLARDLHDEIGPHLFAVSVDAATARRAIGAGETGEASRQLEAMQVSIAHMQRLVRDILGRLRPSELIDLGLAAAIGELADFWRARHPEVVFDVDVADEEDLAISEAARETIYRLVQESLNNAIRHGRPTRVSIAVGREQDWAIAKVTDNGAAAPGPEGAGFGLKGMRERVAVAGGELLVTKAATGWSVHARLPALAPADVLEAAR